MLLENKQVAIIGGGMGGLLLARLLQMQNVNVKVYERDNDDKVRVQGSPLDLHEDSGLKAMEKADLLKEFYANVRPNASKARIVNKDFELKFDEHSIKKSHSELNSKPNTNSLQDISKPRPEIDRSILRSILIQSLLPETIVWNSHFTVMEKENKGWRLHFKNETSFYANLVIAADGANSKVRSYLNAEKPIYSGITMLEGTIYNAKENTPNLFEFSKGGKVLAFGNEQTIMYGTKGDDSLMFLLSSKIPENWISESNLDFKNNQEVFEWFKEFYPEWSSKWHELLLSNELYFIPRPQYYFPLDQTWKTQENLTMIGDAAHRMPPFAGKGANLAMLDALELAECLTGNQFETSENAITYFERQMLERASRATEDTLKNGEQLHSKNALEKLVDIFNATKMQ
ncbi:2-polyprenyl-6-methoxyphenol hydroxylase-like FAD-dependent oxidoreductase [Flavobacterium nitrogenifigens]|uniref:Flavin-dependent monooxygenase n=2 Tax=Flavobacterium TaxID=237 RepID=A0A7W7N8S1_9FLAO|nr:MULTISPECIES: FAD-dependent monooxygenase [Flavobacterium]MBB4802756.1 2-polyprenyl-6-methoxyphenol hydroxylase-like FAD-dependent oxidoreductase [Flavobacterium nitrogenifigens]MBB6387714.1 2-polyprenyl-6-methoxyphenol hydroxylase-like FAD-dependent oxidoreductase [Flavobacterium notoginsengisoli]